MFVRTGTPQVIVDRLSNSLIEFLKSPEGLASMPPGFSAAPTSAAEFASILKSESAAWSEVIQSAKVKPD
jgi:tripartite-type tricarboxylate transporter receptor subunit TctC